MNETATKMNRQQRRNAAKQNKPNNKSKTLTIPEALALAIRSQQSGQLDEAESIYRQILQAKPDYPDALHFLGVLSYQRSRPQEAIELISKAISLNPEYADAHNNLGNVLKAENRNEEAIAAYRKTLALNPNNADAHNNLGVMLRIQNQLEEAVACYQQAVTLNPHHAEAYHNLGNVLSILERHEEAVAAYRQALQINPRHTEAFERIGIELYRLKRNDEAAELIHRWLKLEPENPVALHMLAACSGQAVPSRASDGYVRHLFDRFANDFDEHLQRLEYRAPELVKRALASTLPTANRQLDVLDAGCGTGLCGPLLQPYARRLVGVDLSPGMLAKAQGRGYDELVTAELTEFLQGCSETYDLIASADTLEYFGDLQPVLTAAAGALRTNGHLVFTVEKADESATGFCLNPHGRYSHTEDYLRRTLVETGFTVHILEREDLRLERGWPVAGYLVLASKSH